MDNLSQSKPTERLKNISASPEDANQSLEIAFATADDSGRVIETERPRFILEELLGSGGLCEVYAAIDLYRTGMGDKRPRVALKRPLPEYRDDPAAQLALAREFAKVRALRHPGIIRAYDLHRHDGSLCLTMELAEGPTLKERFLRKPPLEKEAAMNAAAKIFEIVEYLHQAGVIHADIKPGNIFLGPAQPVIFDFNAAVAIPKSGQASTNPAQSLVAFKNLPARTRLYSSPELLDGEPPSPADDIFSAGVTVYELLSGARPFQNISSLEARRKNKKPARILSLSLRQWRYLEKSLRFEPEQRPTAAELVKIFPDRRWKPGFDPRPLWEDLLYEAKEVYGRLRPLFNSRSIGSTPEAKAGERHDPA